MSPVLDIPKGWREAGNEGGREGGMKEGSGREGGTEIRD